jgi:hypothetical protein
LDSLRFASVSPRFASASLRFASASPRFASASLRFGSVSHRFAPAYAGNRPAGDSVNPI